MTLFCQNCGNPDQTPETFCRNCGEFQPDQGQPGKRRITVNGFFMGSAIFSVLTIIWSVALAIGHLMELVQSETSDFLTRATLSMLFCIVVWSILNLYYAITLQSRFQKYRLGSEPVAEPEKVKVFGTDELLNPARIDDNIPASLVDDTTRKLDDKVRR